ncbi:TOR1A protein, partial [Amia calva]|nr:TOR1A protein [Amia calva]
GGFWQSRLIANNLVDVFVPFLPLEHKHVRMCVLTEMKARKMKHNEKIANYIANELEYGPPEKKILSLKGCKSIHAKLVY